MSKPEMIPWTDEHECAYCGEECDCPGDPPDMKCQGCGCDDDPVEPTEDEWDGASGGYVEPAPDEEA